VLNQIVKVFRKKTDHFDKKKWPVTLIISAFNEENVLEEKIHNTAQLNYPAELLTVIIVTDGSTDHSPALVQQYPNTILLHQHERKGKYAAIKRAMLEITTPVVVFSDANSMLNKDAIIHIVSHYADPEVGGVAGEKKILKTIPPRAIGEAEGLYWNYESFMKKQDAALHTVVGAAGELFSIRTDLFRSIDLPVVLDDFIISMQVCLQHFRIVYEPRAFATEKPALSLKEEQKRKVRIAAGSYQASGYLLQALNFLQHPVLAFQYFSRRIIRWFLSPFFLPLILFTNILLVTLNDESSLYKVMLAAQAIFYLFAIAGWQLVMRGKRATIFTIPFYFVFMNYCQACGLFRYLAGKQPAAWEKSLRQVVEQAP
jgi:biofilm PGA synthesis N-glycosyltransferase PgaC